MARQTPADEPHVPRLYLATPLIDDPAALVAALPALFDSADIAAVLLRLAPADERGLINRIKTLAPVIQKAGAALLLDGHADLVARAGADGAHLNGVATMAADLPTLQPDRIAGVGGLSTRHDAMLAGEAGADYVLFGEPDATGSAPPPQAIADTVQWWAEVFQPPCVGYAYSLDEVRTLTHAKADFIMVGDLVWADPRGGAQALAEITDVITTAVAPAA